MTRALLPLVASALLAGCAPSVYDAPYPVGPVALPADEASHPAPIEWWYYTGHLRDAAGADLGFELSFFEAYTPPDLRVGGLPGRVFAERGVVGHAAVTEVSGQSFARAERSSLWGVEASVSDERLAVALGDWRAERVGDGHELALSAEGTTLRLRLVPEKPAALHGAPPGIQSMGPGGVSYYLSYTRMRAEGTVERCRDDAPCETLAVRGEAWHDHQWGDFSLGGYAGWDWFGLQLDDRRELMLYRIRAPDGATLELAGSLVTASGQTLPLDADDAVLEPTGETWTSPDTGAVYPLVWRVRVPRFGIDVRVAPRLDAQEMDTRASTGIVYWEGAVEVEGWPSGLGYMELTSYDRYPYGGGATAPAPPGPFGF